MSAGLPVALVWFSRDLRLHDQPALRAAIESGCAVVPLYVGDPAAAWAPGGAARWWLHGSLAALDAELRARGSRLVLRAGNPLRVVPEVAREVGARLVTFTRHHQPAERARDRALVERLSAQGIACERSEGSLLHTPESLRTTGGGHFLVFTPFWRALAARLDAEPPPPPWPAPRAIPAPAQWPASLPLAALELLPRIDWAAGLRATWSPGEAGARARLQVATRERTADYAGARDRMDLEGTTRLSPHLHAGELSPAEAWHALRDAPGSAALLRQLAWREFAYHLLVHRPDLPEAPLRPAFARFPWRDDPEGLGRWQRGLTGYPLVDAGMRELWATGHMHNRARMVTASFLVKHLLVDWRAGARWFWDTLCDADLANNTLGWQWVAGCGPDAAPYFRVFNPVLQGEKFDPHGDYVRRWVPELARLPARFIHRPWQAPAEVLREAGVELTRDYPRPIVEHEVARARALGAFHGLREL